MTENKFNMPAPKQKGKKAIIVTACTTNKIGDLFAGESKGAHKALHEIFHYSGIKIVGYVNKNDTKNDRVITEGMKRKIQYLCNKL